MVDGEAEESGTVPYTISEESGFSYGSGRGGTAGRVNSLHGKRGFGWVALP